MNKIFVGLTCLTLYGGAMPLSALTIGSDSLSNTNPFTASVISTSASRKQSEVDSAISSNENLKGMDDDLSVLTGKTGRFSGERRGGKSVGELLSALEAEVEIAYSKASSAYSLGSSAKGTANSAYSKANSAYNVGVSARNTANSAYSNARNGGTVQHYSCIDWSRKDRCRRYAWVNSSSTRIVK